MPRVARMGASVSLAEDQAPLGRSVAHGIRRAPSGGSVPFVISQPAGTVLAVVHFVELDDGRRATTEELGKMSLQMSLDCTEAELREEVREFIFEDDMRGIPELRDEPRWDDMIGELARLGVVADEAALGQLPFQVEVDEHVLARLRR